MYFHLYPDTEYIVTNLIRPDGHIAGLSLNAGQLLIVRDHDGGSSDPFGNAIPPIPITVDQQMVVDSGGVLRMEFEQDPWDSTISFSAGILVRLGGTLELTFADGVDLASQIGRSFDLFDWTGVSPIGAFAVSSPYVWDLANLYTSGDVTFLAAQITGDFNGDGSYDCADVDALVSSIAGGTNPSAFDLTSDGLVNSADLSQWLTLAGANNLASGNPYLPADGNLDGFVDGLDFILWNGNKFTSNAGWCGGDFNADGVTDGQDFIVWNSQKFMSSDGVSAIPEPSTSALLVVTMALATGSWRSARQRSVVDRPRAFGKVS